VSYPRITQLMVEEGIVDIGDLRPDQWREKMLERWYGDPIQPEVIKLWNGVYIKLLDRRSKDGDTVSLALNITDTIRYEKRLKEAREKAEAANRAKSAFLANMSLIDKLAQERRARLAAERLLKQKQEELLHRRSRADPPDSDQSPRQCGEIHIRRPCVGAGCGA